MYFQIVYIRNYARIVRQGGDHSKKATLHPQHLHPKSRSERETVKARAALVKSLEDRETLQTHVKLSLASRRMQLQYKCFDPLETNLKWVISNFSNPMSRIHTRVLGHVSGSSWTATCASSQAEHRIQNQLSYQQFLAGSAPLLKIAALELTDFPGHLLGTPRLVELLEQRSIFLCYGNNEFAHPVSSGRPLH